MSSSAKPERSCSTMRLNGEVVPLRAVLVSELMAELGHAGRRGIAVAVNGEVVPRSRWARRAIRGGDAIEVVGASQGG